MSVDGSTFAANFKNNPIKQTNMEAIVLKLAKANVFDKINNAIPYLSLLAVGYFIGCWVYAIL